MTVVAIDFGTSNTVVSIWDPVTQTPQTLQFEQISRQFALHLGAAVVPTLVFVQAPNQILIGEEIRSKRLGLVQPERLFQAFKRDLVADFVPPARYLDGTTYDPDVIATRFLQGVIQALHQAAWVPTRLIMTVPVGAYEAYVNWLRQTALELNLPPLQILDESTAAALGYAVQHPGAIVLVLDFGGGTLDLSLVKTVATTPSEDLKAEVIAKSDAYVGGIDIDAWIVDHFLKQLNTSRAELGETGWQTLLDRAEQLKIKLSSTEVASEAWFNDLTVTAHELTLSRQDLDEILEAQHMLDQVRDALDEVLVMAQSKGIDKSQIDQVLLVGGTSQVPAIQQLVMSYFGRKRVKSDKPFEAIAHGALWFGQQVKLQDYLRHSYAIRLWDPYTQSYTYYPLFEKGLKYPCQRPNPLVLQVALDGQDEIRLDIGEVADRSQSEVAYDDFGRMTSRRVIRQTDFRTLAGGTDPICIAHLDPVGKAGLDRIEVYFKINEQRQLSATVFDLYTQTTLVQDVSVAKLQ